MTGLTEIMAQFNAWLSEAKAELGEEEAVACALATASAAARPSARIVLLRGADERGFVFFTNLESRKGRELEENPHAALCFHWFRLNRQVRVEGRVEPVESSEADAYFASRARESRIGAWASAQSKPLQSREALQHEIESVRRRYEGKPVPRPPFWGGFRIVPETIEFWSRGDFRLHERDCYVRASDGSWNLIRLNP